MSTTITYTGRLVPVSCCECGVTFAMPEGMHERRLNDHGWFYCPAGHKQYFAGETEEQKLRRTATWLRSQVDQERARGDHEAARARGYKGALTKTKKRIGRGVCPCCNRQFPDLAAHMSSKHPAYVDHEPGASPGA